MDTQPDEPRYLSPYDQFPETPLGESMRDAIDAWDREELQFEADVRLAAAEASEQFAFGLGWRRAIAGLLYFAVRRLGGWEFMREFAFELQAIWQIRWAEDSAKYQAQADEDEAARIRRPVQPDARQPGDDIERS